MFFAADEAAAVETNQNGAEIDVDDPDDDDDDSEDEEDTTRYNYKPFNTSSTLLQ